MTYPKGSEHRWPLQILRLIIDKMKSKVAGFMWLNVLLLLLLNMKLIKEAVFWHVRCSFLSINYSCCTLRHSLKNVFLQVKEKMEWWSHCLHFSWQLELRKRSTFGLCRLCACFCEVSLFEFLCLFGVLVFFCFGFFGNVNTPVLAPWFFASHIGDRNSSSTCQVKLLNSYMCFGEKKQTKKKPHNVALKRS